MTDGGRWVKKPHSPPSLTHRCRCSAGSKLLAAAAAEALVRVGVSTLPPPQLVPSSTNWELDAMVAVARVEASKPPPSQVACLGCVLFKMMFQTEGKQSKLTALLDGDSM